MIKPTIRNSTHSHRIAGAGLVALDVVLYRSESADALTYAGGTCGNVLSILSYLQWMASAVGFLGDDDAGARVLDDLTSVGVKASHLVKNSSWVTPIFVQRLQQDEQGKPRHTFTQQCPRCGQDMQPAKSEKVRATPIRQFSRSESPDVFFMDRLSDDILSLAKSAKSQGALIFYEPSAKSDVEFWQGAFALVDIVKYSADRFDEDELAPFTIPAQNSNLWEIQTLGARGLRYRRSSGDGISAAAWIDSPAITAPRVVDTCGAGDWCSAGLLYGLLGGDRPDSTQNFAQAIRLGQGLAAWACAFVGARGAMYCSDSTATLGSVRRLVDGKSVDVSSLPTTAPNSPAAGAEACGVGICTASRP